MELMLSGFEPGLMDVRGYLLAKEYGGGTAPNEVDRNFKPYTDANLIRVWYRLGWPLVVQGGRFNIGAASSHERCGWGGLLVLQFRCFKGIDVFQIKATIRGSKVKEAAPSAVEALRRYRDIQTRPGVTACSVMKGGVLVGQAELVSAATVEDLRAKSGIWPRGEGEVLQDASWFINDVNRQREIDSSFALDGCLPWARDARMDSSFAKDVPRLQMLVLDRSDPAQNMARFYVLAIEPTLFGDVALVREWGRRGCSGRRRLDLYGDQEAAAEALQDWLLRKTRRGYGVVAASVTNEGA